ncbi:MAG TPA: response regulator [Burkholderiales bacterium]|nr:response regulator [Burkholderiales bacterium]
MNPSTQSAPANKTKIAVIDDDRFIRYLLDLHLRKAGYEVFAAEDAVAAGRVIVERTPDVILCDVDMPFMDGYEFVSALRADPATRHIPVIFLTVNKSVGERAKQLGAGHLVKPVTADELLRTVAKFAPPAHHAQARI